MTNRDFFNAIINNNVTDEVIGHATAELEKLDSRNAKRANTQSKTQKENEPIKASIMELFTSNELVLVASNCAESLGISTQKASALLRQLVEENKLTKLEVKVPKKGKQIGYTLFKEVDAGE